MKLEEKNKARGLRQQGFSIQQIADSLAVSKGSISAWVRDIELSQDALVNIGDRLRLGREKSRKARLFNILNRNNALYAKCKDEILPFSKRDLWISGLMIYAGEGTKTSRVSNQHIEVTNSDPNILRLFINFLIHICFVPEDKIKIRLILYEDIVIKDALIYWSKELNIPISQFRKPFIKKSYRNLPYRHLRRLKYGTAHVNVYDVNVYRKVMDWLEAIYEYNNFNFGKSGE